MVHAVIFDGASFRFLFAASVTAVSAVCGCDTSTTPLPYTPYTGIDVPTSAITNGVGCGPDTIDHYAVLITPQLDAGALPEASSVIAAAIFACYVPVGVFENLDGGAFAVWMFGFPAGVPADVPCAAGTCALSPAGVSLLLADVGRGLATRTVLCTADQESGQHSPAYNCHTPLGNPTAPSGTDGAAEAAADATVDGGSASVDADGGAGAESSIVDSGSVAPETGGD